MIKRFKVVAHLGGCELKPLGDGLQPPMDEQLVKVSDIVEALQELQAAAETDKDSARRLVLQNLMLQLGQWHSPLKG